MASFLKKFVRFFSPADKITFSTDTPYNYLEVRKQNGRFVLDSRNTNYSFGGLHKVFQQAFHEVPLHKQAIKKALILGFGAGSIAHILQNELHCNCEITGVEIDKEVIGLAKQFFNLKSLVQTKVVVQDALLFVADCQEQFDLITVDIFENFRTTEKFNTIEFLQSLSGILSEKGVVYYNRLCYDYWSKEENKKFETLFKSHFSETKIVKTRHFSKNRVYVGKRGDGMV